MINKIEQSFLSFQKHIRRRSFMGLKSALFRGDAKLEACLVSNPAHKMEGASGDHVSKIHQALSMVDESEISPDELSAKKYGSSTAAAVLSFKTKRKIINKAYQSKPDNIVGKMTIAALDNEVYFLEIKRLVPPDLRNWTVTTSRRDL
jgi:hypothetical protein